MIFHKDVKHPYDYITKDNWEQIKSAFSMGITQGKTPIEIAKLISEATGLDQTVSMGIVQAELIDTLKVLDGDEK